VLLRLEQVSYRYAQGADWAVEGVQMQIGEGEVVAVVGESGSGKTTLGKIAAWVFPPTRGRVWFDDADVWSLDRREFAKARRKVQVVHQDPYASLNPSLTVRSILAPALLYHGLATRANVDEVIDEVLDLVGLETGEEFGRRYPHQLSGGQRQRLAVARAVSLGPKLIVADEVTSMLDVSLRVSILDLLRSLRLRHNIAFLFISHDLGVVRYFVQGGVVLVMYGGLVVEEATVEDLISRPKHPYSFLLLESVPVPDPAIVRARRDKQRASVIVQALDAGRNSEGCVFAARCPFKDAICEHKRPELAEVGTRHRSACFFPDRVPPQLSGVA
jgi:oligopeptide/dipeptide ABC transporter ATP-binding protein